MSIPASKASAPPRECLEKVKIILQIGDLLRDLQLHIKVLYSLPSYHNLIAWISIVLTQELRKVVRGSFKVSIIETLVDLSTTDRSVISFVKDQILIKHGNSVSMKLHSRVMMNLFAILTTTQFWKELVPRNAT